jgi:hypothetical protein
MEAFGQDVAQEASNELVRRERHGLLPVAAFGPSQAGARLIPPTPLEIALLKAAGADHETTRSVRPGQSIISIR